MKIKNIFKILETELNFSEFKSFPKLYLLLILIAYPIICFQLLEIKSGLEFIFGLLFLPLSIFVYTIIKDLGHINKQIVHYIVVTFYLILLIFTMIRYDFLIIYLLLYILILLFSILSKKNVINSLLAIIVWATITGFSIILSILVPINYVSELVKLNSIFIFIVSLLTIFSKSKYKKKYITLFFSNFTIFISTIFTALIFYLLLGNFLLLYDIGLFIFNILIVTIPTIYIIPILYYSIGKNFMKLFGINKEIIWITTKTSREKLECGYCGANYLSNLNKCPVCGGKNEK